MKKFSITAIVGVLIIIAVSISLSDVKLLAQSNKSTWKAPASADELKNPFKDDGEAWENAEETFQTLCAVCHGEGGEGDGIAALGINPKPANLISAAVQTQSDGAIFYKMTNGRPPMASYKDALSEEQRWTLVKYIRHLAAE